MLVNDGVPAVLEIPRAVMMDKAIAQAQHSSNNPHTVELPNSQESILSAASSTFSAPGLLPSSSNVSVSTTTDTEPASSATSHPSSSQSQPKERAISPVQDVQPASPKIDTVDAPRTGDTAASPMSLEFPAIPQGSKRTACGVVKTAGVTVECAVVPVKGHKRSKSESSNPRIGEISAQLRSRLSYAMVKVQNGWEKKSLEELEDETSQRGSPISLLDSPREMNRPRRPSAISETSDQMLMSPSQASPRDLSASMAPTPSSYWRYAPSPSMNGAVNGISTRPIAENGAVLAPAAEIGPRRKRRSTASYVEPPMLGSTPRKHYSDMGASPRTPMAAPRPGILRMPSQQAEKDAVDTLLFMSSPNNSGRVPHTSMDQQHYARPLKPEIPRRVMFESHMSKDRPGDNRQPDYGNGIQHAFYRRTDQPR